MKKEKEMKLNLEAEEFRREELSGRYAAKLLYGQDDKKFNKEYLKKLERNWNRWKKKSIMEHLNTNNSIFIFFYFSNFILILFSLFLFFFR